MSNKANSRNIGIVAHIDAGKTTTTERILYFSGVIPSPREVHDGEATMDFMDQEREKGITIAAATIHLFWKMVVEGGVLPSVYEINVIDTPGHVDFTAEVERSLRVLDGAIIVVCSVGGIEAQTETVWRQANKYKVPGIVFVNKMDRSGADFGKVVNDFREKLGVIALPLQCPIGEGADFKGVVDLLLQRAIYWDDSGDGVELVYGNVPEELTGMVDSLRNQLVDKVIELSGSEELLETFLNEGIDAIPVEDLKKHIREAVVNRKIFPVFCGSSLKNKGVKLLLNAVCDYLPSPADSSEVVVKEVDKGCEVKLKRDPKESFTALVFKIKSSRHGRLAYVRLYSGSVNVGEMVYNVRTREKNRISRIVRMYASKEKQIKYVEAGDICAFIGLKQARTGDTLVAVGGKMLVLEPITFPDPVIHLAIEPKKQTDNDRLVYAINELKKEDPTFSVRVEPGTKRLILEGMGELHLHIKIEQIRREFGVETICGFPQVAYKECFTDKSVYRHIHKKQTGGAGQFADLEFELAPSEEPGLVFFNKMKGDGICSSFVEAIKAGFKEAMLEGPLAGYPLVGMQVTLQDGSSHSVDSSQHAFKRAAIDAFRIVSKRTAPMLMEPVTLMEVTIPKVSIGVITGDISKRRGVVLERKETVGDSETFVAHVPHSELFGYVSFLRGKTAGRGNATMEFSHYAKVPSEITDKIVEKRRE